MKISLLVDLVSILEVLVTNQHDNGSGGNEDTHSDELSQSQAGQADIGGQRQNDEDQNQNSLQSLGVHLQGGLFIDIGEQVGQTEAGNDHQQVAQLGAAGTHVGDVSGVHTGQNGNQTDNNEEAQQNDRSTVLVYSEVISRQKIQVLKKKLESTSSSGQK